MTDSPDSTALGNTISNATTLRKAVFTLNNWTQEEYDMIVNGLTQKSHDFIIGKEVGESGTPHLQGYVEFKSALKFRTVKNLLPRAHIEKAHGTREQNIKYCSKDGDFISRFPMPRRERLLMSYDHTIWKDWQLDVINIVNSTPDSRSIHWFWEATGNTGKSFLAKFLFLKYKCIIADGKKDNIFHQVKTFLDENPDEDPVLVLLDVPRSASGYVCYGAIEQLKNGLIYSGKYEGGACVFNPPHVIVFANTPPSDYDWSADRLIVREIN